LWQSARTLTFGQLLGLVHGFRMCPGSIRAKSRRCASYRRSLELRPAQLAAVEGDANPVVRGHHGNPAKRRLNAVQPAGMEVA
jgi:hypothetical protein